MEAAIVLQRIPEVDCAVKVTDGAFRIDEAVTREAVMPQAIRGRCGRRARRQVEASADPGRRPDQPAAAGVCKIVKYASRSSFGAQSLVFKGFRDDDPRRTRLDTIVTIVICSKTGPDLEVALIRWKGAAGGRKDRRRLA